MGRLYRPFKRRRNSKPIACHAAAGCGLPRATGVGRRGPRQSEDSQSFRVPTVCVARMPATLLLVDLVLPGTPERHKTLRRVSDSLNRDSALVLIDAWRPSRSLLAFMLEGGRRHFPVQGRKELGSIAIRRQVEIREHAAPLRADLSLRFATSGDPYRSAAGSRGICELFPGRFAALRRRRAEERKRARKELFPIRRQGTSFVLKIAMGFFDFLRGDAHLGEASHPGPMDRIRAAGKIVITDGKEHVGDTFEKAWKDAGFVKRLLKKRNRTPQLQGLAQYFQAKSAKELVGDYLSAAGVRAQSPPPPVDDSTRHTTEEAEPQTDAQPLPLVPIARIRVIQRREHAAVREPLGRGNAALNIVLASERPFQDLLAYACSVGVTWPLTHRSLLIIGAIILLPNLAGLVVGSFWYKVVASMGIFLTSIFKCIIQAIGETLGNIGMIIGNFESYIVESFMNSITLGAYDLIGKNHEQAQVFRKTESFDARLPTPFVDKITQLLTVFLAYVLGKACTGDGGDLA